MRLSGHSNTKIAGRIGRSEGLVKKILREQVFEPLGASSLSEVMRRMDARPGE